MVSPQKGLGRLAGPLRLSIKPQVGPQKSSFSTGFIRLFDMAECHVVYSEKPNAFLIILEAILRFGLENYPNSTGFIRYFEQLFRRLQIALGPMLFQHSAKS